MTEHNPEDAIDRLCTFIKERHLIYQRRFVEKKPKPWTKDPILQQYRFCNVYRELDTQTEWLFKNWGNNGKNTDPNYWFACAVFRLTNWHETAEELGYPVPFNKLHFIKVLNARKKRGDKVYNGAYIISTNGVKMEKSEYLAEKLGTLYKEREYIRYKPKEPLEEFAKRLQEFDTMGSFITGQVVADLKYVGAARKAPDWWTYVTSGPGSRRGLGRVMEGTPDMPLSEEDWQHCINVLMDEYVEGYLAENDMPKMHLQDLQNCLCEFDKYERVRLGEGRPKSKYPGV